jgi:hypothetical protein
MELKEEVLAHYDRMISWAEKQDADLRASAQMMQHAIDDCWHGLWCPLCDRFWYLDCMDCPVKKETGLIGCTLTPWYKLNEATTWSEWLVAAKEEREFLALLDYEE